MRQKKCKVGLSILERQGGAVTLSPKASSHAGEWARWENGKNKTVWARMWCQLVRWRCMFFKSSAATEIAENDILKNREIAHMAARLRAFATSASVTSEEIVAACQKIKQEISIT